MIWTAAQIERLLQDPLPGAEAQWKMAPAGRIREFPDTDLYRLSAVMVLLVPTPNHVSMVLTLRAEYPGVHSGQISFPGGKFEPGEMDPVDVALREAREEIGLNVETVSILGRLSPLPIPVSKMWVYPVVGWVPQPQQWIRDEREVQQVLEIPLHHFMLQQYRGTMVRNVGQHPIEVPAFTMVDVPIWGATSMIISELVTVLSP